MNYILEKVRDIWAQVTALHNLSEAMDAINWTDETPMGFEIFLKGIEKQLGDLYNAMKNDPLFLPSDLKPAQAKPRKTRTRQKRKIDHDNK